jgi:alpha/beta superfamily hydrolase
MSSCDKLSSLLKSEFVNGTKPLTEAVFVPGAAGQLEALVEESAAPSAVAVLCHPHSEYGGSMQDLVLEIMGDLLGSLNIASVRFNFRGVGQSGGEFDNGEGEVQDVLSVAGWASHRWPELPLILGGYSFGAAMALIAAARIEEQVSKLILVAPPIQMMESDNALKINSCIILGGRDTLVSASAASQYFGSDQITVLPQADHFFAGAHIELTKHIREFLNGA